MCSLWNILYERNYRLLPNAATPDTTLIDQPKVQVIYHGMEEELPPMVTSTDFNYLEMLIEKAHSMNPAKFSGKNRPDCFLKMIKNEQLSRVESGKDVHHFEFEAVSCSIDYDVGDILEVLPGQSTEALNAFMQRCNLNPESYITVQSRDTENCGFLKPSSPVKLKSFIELTMDIASASPRRYFFEVMSFFATDEHEKERLQYFASPERRDDLYEYNQKERRTVLEVLEDFPSVQMPFEWLIQLVPPLKKRAFSISSSHSAHPIQVHLTVSVVSWTTPYKRKRTGLCSSWLKTRKFLFTRLKTHCPQKVTHQNQWQVHRKRLPKNLVYQFNFSAFLSWIPLGYIFESPLLETLLKFFPIPAYRNLTLQCLTEVAALSFGDFYNMQYINMYTIFMVQLQAIVPSTTNFIEAYANGNTEEQAFIQNLALFFTSFYKVMHSIGFRIIADSKRRRDKPFNCC